MKSLLREASRARGGPLAFETFMQLALHAPEAGYYARRITAIGPAGDFSTAATLDPLLARGVARWLAGEAEARGWKTWPVIECGPGTGVLAAGILQAAGWWKRRRIHLHLVESSAPLREQQARQLRGHRVIWHANIAAALQACDGKALIYHNEFFDAFPCRVLRWSGEAWQELFLDVTADAPREEWGEPARPLPACSAVRRRWPKGQRVELLEAVRPWLRDLAGGWREGAMLTLDYGGPVEELYHRRPHGTLRGYFMQQRLEGPEVYGNPGRQDITADVNFTDLALWSVEAGLKVHALQTQSDFLHRHAAASGRMTTAAGAYLLDPQGMGGAVRALVVEPQGLSGGGDRL